MQSFGVELLVLLDGWAWQSAGVPQPPTAEDMPEAVWQEDVDPDPDLDWDYTEVEWAPSSQDEWALIQAQLAANRVTVSDPEPAERSPATPDTFDREWT